jgi:hypothetical protein
MNNIPYQSPQRSVVPKNFKEQYSKKPKITPPLTLKFSQANLFTLVMRQIFNNRVSLSFNAIRNKQKKRFHVLEAINDMTKRRLIFGLDKISSYGRKVKSETLKNQMNRANFKAYLIRASHKLLKTTLNFSFKKIFLYQYKRNGD